MTRYPYDPTGKADTNAFTEERILESNENTNRVVMLTHAPFFGSLEILNGNSTTPLVEGTDYEYVYELSALKNALALDAPPVYCGVQFINPEISGSLQFTGHLLGGSFYDPLTEILDYLIKYINNPRQADYRSLTGVPALFPQKPSYVSWADTKNKQYLASAVDDVREAMDTETQDLSADLKEMSQLADQLYADIEAFNYPAHIAAKNPHVLTATQLNAHPVGLEVPDTVLSFGLTLRQLIENIRSQGLSDADIQLYMHRYPSKNVKGTFFFADGSAVIADASGNTKLILGSTKIQLITQGSIVAAAGTDLSGAKYVEYVCGTNTLRVTTNGDKLGIDKLTLNGKPLLTARGIKKYQSKDENGDPENVQINIQSTNIDFTGKGTPSAPLKGTLRTPKATKTTDGVVTLKAAAGAGVDGEAIIPAAAKPYNDGFNDMVPKTLLINNKPISGTGITLDKSDLNLSDVDNTPDLAKPLSTPQKTRTDALVDKNHHHDWSMLQIGQATEQDYGTVMIAKTLDEVKDGQAVAPVVLKGLSDRLALINKRFSNVMFRDTLEFTTIGASTFNVNGWVLSPLADVRYFIAKTLDASEGTIDGTVDLSKVSSEEWYLPYCGIERSWKTGVVHNVTLANPLPQAKAISTSATLMGSGGLRLVSRVRIKCAEDVLRVRVRSASLVSVWIDDVVAATVTTDPDVTMEVVPNKVHVISVMALCEDPSKPASFAYDVTDGSTLVYNSSATTKLGQLDAYLPPTNNRFFLYANVILGKFQALGAPRQDTNVNSEMLYVGHVDTDDIGVVTDGGPLSFGQVIDFGDFRELDVHEADVNAHAASDENDPDYNPGDVKVVGLESTKPYGVASKAVVATPDVAVFSNAAGMTLRTQGTLVVAEGSVAAPLRVWVGIDGQSPFRWKNMANPYESNKVTFDGSIMFNDTGILEFVAQALNGRHEVLSLYSLDNLDAATASVAFVNEVTPQPVAMAYSDIPRTSLIPFTVKERGAVAGAVNLPSFVDGTAVKRPPLLILRYRYVPAEKRFTYILSMIDPITRAESHQMNSLVFEQDLTRFFEAAYVGYSSGSKTGYRIMGSLFDSGIAQGNLAKVNYHKGLLRSYLRGSELQKYAQKNNGLQLGLVNMFHENGTFEIDMATQVIVQEPGTNLINETTSYAVPHAMWRQSRPTVKGRDSATVFDYQNPGSAVRAIAPAPIWQSGMAALLIAPELMQNAKSVNVSVTGRGTIAAWIDGTQYINVTQTTFSGAATASKAVPTGSETTGHFNIVILPTAAGENTFVEATFIITYNDGSTATVTTNDARWRVAEYGKLRATAMRNPYNLTQRNWEYVLGLVALEKD